MIKSRELKSSKPLKRAQEDRMREQGYLTVADTARLAGVNRQSVNLWIEKRSIKTTRVGLRIYVERASLETYLGPEGARALLAGT